jgi:hypothetical protein
MATRALSLVVVIGVVTSIPSQGQYRTSPGVAGELFVSTGAPTTRHTQDHTAIVAALEVYQSGEFDPAVAQLLAGREITALSGAFKRDSGRWIDQASLSERGLRTATVAAMAVELMAASFQQHAAQYAESREIVEWACSRVRRMTPTDFERMFHLASTALIQGARDEGWLGGVQHPLSPPSIPGGDSHPRHAGLRFPNEPRFKLAYLTSRPETTYLSIRPLPPNNLVTGGSFYRFSIEGTGNVGRIQDTLRLLAVLFNEPAIEHEAHLRSGVVRLMVDQITEATTDLQRAVSADDPLIRNIAHLLLGSIDDRQRRWAEALRHYQAAHESVPASTSSIALASLLFRTGRETQAAEVVARFSQQEPPPDPWRLYGQRDYRFYPEYRSKMRQALLKLR